MKENVNVMAVFCDDTHRIARFDEMTNFVFYTKTDDGWGKSDPIPFSCDLSGGLASIRENISQMLGAFNDCRIIIAKAIIGIPYQVFDRSGFIICESEDFDLELLDAIQADLISQDGEAKEDASLLAQTPEETDVPGYYRFDLTQVQKKHPEMSSKMALLPFLKETPFYALEVVCDHIPPWFEHQLAAMKMQYRIENKNNSTKHVVITHAGCE
ncbi:Fe-only nitrogenase accessory AnfO family protein [Acetobacterium sp.]|uniref:Fe-only nitrogenase accessory AnfO family protein n=1 Tax=Acetobacterium sp. TaxID=1872094 RepID=UPI002722AE2F|nr:Fe-only nitrogenase accessory AnfO family protein [Acetobacterium sp.]MDO9491945.1 Fe-only nitrogenase accessory AnfO family protein [Acetobacterium sp.]